MKKTTSLITALAFAVTFVATAADDDRDTRRGPGAELDNRIQTINRLDDNASAKRAGLNAVSKETAVPLPTIEAEAKDHPTMGLGGLFMAHELSVKTKKPVDQLIKQRQTGKMWSEIARDNRQNIPELDQKLARIENAMRNPNAATREDRTAVRERERDANRTGLNRRVESLNTLEDKPGVMNAGLAALSKETGTPLPQIETLQKAHKSAGIGDLFVAEELAVTTRKPGGEYQAADVFLKQHANGKSWSEIIRENNGNQNTIEQKLSRIEQAMKDAPK
jgi:hypothetical protein